MNFRTKKHFENAFKKAVTNFDETRIHFEHPSRMHDESFICFVLNGKLKKLPMYKDSHYIDIWKNYFIEYLNTGEFDYNAYWQIYESKNKVHPKILKFPFGTFYGNEFYPNSKEMSAYLTEVRKTLPGCGIKQVPKPTIKTKELTQGKIYYNPKVKRAYIVGGYLKSLAGILDLIEFAKTSGLTVPEPSEIQIQKLKGDYHDGFVSIEFESKTKPKIEFSDLDKFPNLYKTALIA